MNTGNIEMKLEQALELKEELKRCQSALEPRDYQLLLELLEDIRENASLIHNVLLTGNQKGEKHDTV